VQEAGLGDRISFTGQVPDAFPYMHRLDVLVNASDHEPFGLVLVEAMALGVPVLAIRSAGPEEIVDDGRSGFLVPTRSADSIAGGLRRLAGSPALRADMGREGRRVWLERFTAERMTREMEQRLEALAA